MVALENGIVTDSTLVDVEHSPYRATDHVLLRGQMTVTQVIAQSSNVGTANILCDAFYKRQNDYYQGISNLCFDKPMNFDLPVKKPNIAGRGSVFDKKVFGYVIVPPIYMLRFYNAIANEGRMIEPFLVQDVRTGGGKSAGRVQTADGEKKFPVKKGEVVCPKICSEKTLKSVQNMLLEVMKTGTGKAYRSKQVVFAGKTGTADIITSNASQGSFCGYFPVDTTGREKPKYSCIVVMYKTTAYNLWGTYSCAVFKNIAEGITAMTFPRTPDDLATHAKPHQLLPVFKNGNGAALKDVASFLHVKTEGENSRWVTVRNDSNKIVLTPLVVENGKIPNVRGMGAKDAVYLIEKAGFRVGISGAGKVSEVIYNTDKKTATIILKK